VSSSGRGRAWWWWIALAILVVVLLAGGAVVVVSDQQLRAILRTLPAKRIGDVPALNAAMREFRITTPARVAAFLAQVGHESGDFQWFEEIWGPTASQLGYEGRADLGNTVAGDGYRYHGRGAIQLTGRKNYERASAALGVDLVAHPELAATSAYAYRIAAWFWDSHGLNELADVGDFDRISQIINGGKLGQSNGHADRVARFDRARSALGLA
jgi:putative chitinase